MSVLVGERNRQKSVREERAGPGAVAAMLCSLGGLIVGEAGPGVRLPAGPGGTRARGPKGVEEGRESGDEQMGAVRAAPVR